jgi:hypothetical protein
MSKRADYFSASQKAYKAIVGMIQQQARMLSFLGMARLFGILFVIALPLIFLMASRSIQPVP